MNFFADKKMISKLAFVATFIVLSVLVVLPAVVSAAPLVPCGTEANSTACTFKDIFELIANIITFLLFTLGLPLCAIAIVWGGVTIVLNPANPGARSKGLDMIKNACIGLAIALASYLIVDTLLTLLTDETLETLQEDAGVTDGVNGNDAGS